MASQNTLIALNQARREREAAIQIAAERERAERERLHTLAAAEQTIQKLELQAARENFETQKADLERLRAENDQQIAVLHKRLTDMTVSGQIDLPALQPVVNAISDTYLKHEAGRMECLNRMESELMNTYKTLHPVDPTTGREPHYHTQRMGMFQYAQNQGFALNIPVALPVWAAFAHCIAHMTGNAQKVAQAVAWLYVGGDIIQTTPGYDARQEVRSAQEHQRGARV